LIGAVLICGIQGCRERVEIMGKYRISKVVYLLLLAAVFVFWGIDQVRAQSQTTAQPSMRDSNAIIERMQKRITQADRQAAAARRAAAVRQGQKSAQAGPLSAPAGGGKSVPLAPAMPMPGGTPDYFNVANWANSPLPTVGPKGTIIGGIRKFVDTLPGLGYANRNNLGQYIPIANPDTITYPGSDYYEIGLVDYEEQMHSDLPATELRGYVQLNNGTDPATNLNTVAPAPVHYLGPQIIAQQDRPVRIKFTNMLGIGAAGDLFLPVDTTVMGAGMGPDVMLDANGMPMLDANGMPMMEMYQQNRATIHLHGGNTPWISDGTPHQWTVPLGDVNAHYQKGLSAQDVPDMPASGQGAMTFYYTNQQSARLMFYHDHSYGITRLNVYAGEAAGYLVTDPVEEDLIRKKILPDLGGVYHYGIPLIVQDKTFVDANTIGATDPTWNWGSMPGMPMMGDLWFPHVYMPNQNPADPTGANAFGRWDYGPWFWPPVTASAGLVHGPITLPDETQIPGTPNPSMVMEAFMDTPLVNGTAYPVLPVERRAYRFRILNACNDRYLNLQLYYADPAKPTEVKMVPAVLNATFPANWPTDGRDGGVPDPRRAGPPIIQIGTEGGFLPSPVVIPSTPIGYVYNRRDIVVLNVSDHALFLGPAERADVIIDFSKVPRGAKLILYNDAPAPVPGFDPRLDYYTGDPNMTDTGGAPTTLAGYGPNIRTIMQFRVAGGPAAAAFDVNALDAIWPAVYAASQPVPIVPETTYPAPYAATVDTYARIQDNNLTFIPVGSVNSITVSMKSKAIQELFEMDYGRMNSTLGVELPFTNSQNQTTIPLGYIDPPTEFIQDGNTQIWKITHNGVDTHAVHFHLFNVQLINRVGWDGAVRPPEKNELGWKETVRMNPLEDCIVAFKPIAPALPFAVPDSNRPFDVTMPVDSNFQSIDPVTNQAYTVINVLTNFGWEYMWHCHLLGHEEMDMMRPIVMTDVNDYVTPVSAPYGLTAEVVTTQRIHLSWTDDSNNETGFRIERVIEPNTFEEVATVEANVMDYNDTTVAPAATYAYRVFDFNDSGDSLPSNTAMVTTTAPTAPSNLVAAASALSTDLPTVTLTWADNSNNETSFSIQRATNAAFTKGLATFTVGANVTTFTDTTVATRTRYYYRVLAFNAIGSSAWSVRRTVLTSGQLPAAPSGLTVGTITRTSVVLSWTNNATNQTGVVIQRATNAGFTTSRLSTTVNKPTLTTRTMTGLRRNTTYYFRVAARNAAGNSAFSNVVSATTLP
jgi:FtsP/CotA-like multicopper oxidase with cupredoxin domain